MDIPRGFKRWRFHWFECPACRYRASRAFTQVAVKRKPPSMMWRYWCERCGAFSTLARPMMPAVAGGLLLLFVGPIAFAVVFYLATVGGVKFEGLVALFGAFWLAYPLLFLGLTRLIYRYVPAAP